MISSPQLRLKPWLVCRVRRSWSVGLRPLGAGAARLRVLQRQRRIGHRVGALVGAADVGVDLGHDVAQHRLPSDMRTFTSAPSGTFQSRLKRCCSAWPTM